MKGTPLIALLSILSNLAVAAVLPEPKPVGLIERDDVRILPRPFFQY